MTRRTDRRNEPTDEYLDELDAWWESAKDLYPMPEKAVPEPVAEAKLPPVEPEPMHPF